MNEFEKNWSLTAKDIDTYLKVTIPHLFHSETKGLKTLSESIAYSTLDAGKRFRPVLAIWSMEALGQTKDRILPFAAAIEMIHCYSLIHDDLPCMDDDDFRRGKPSNHKVYGDAMALLAGNALLTEAIALVSQSYREEPALALELIDLLTQSSGYNGMIGGQAIDVFPSPKGFTKEELLLLHKLKTGAMIRIAPVGAAKIAKTNQKETMALTAFGEKIGLAFQVADDILDYEETNPEANGYPAVIGIDATKKLLADLTNEADSCLELFGKSAEKLKQLCLFNLKRNQ